MTVTTTYTCDKCGCAEPTSDQMWQISVVVSRWQSLPVTIGSAYTHRKNLWCRKCIEALGLLPPPRNEKNEHVINPSPTFEDMVREIVHEEMSQSE